jgi:glutamate synthase domain-containing protein 2
MAIFWAVTGIIIAVVVTVILIRRDIERLLYRGGNRLLSEWLSSLDKLTWKGFFESNLRAETGKPLDRPYGSQRAMYWDMVLFNPAYLATALPLDGNVRIDTEVMLGPHAFKPLWLKIPILIGGMAYGSGYSPEAKIALAKAATKSGIAANSGNGPFLEEERFYAERFTLQYTRGFWSKNSELLQKADMIEIALGHSACGSAPVRIKGKKVTKAVAARYGSIPGLDVLMESRLPEVESRDDWRELISRLKEVTGGVPIAVKFGASHYLEEEMEIFIDGGIDVLVFDGLEGGTHGGMPLFMDDIGLPLFPALCRAANYLRKQGLKNQVSLVVGGGLSNPGDFAKCLALGADAILVGTITALAQTHTQISKTIPWEPPTGLLYNDGKEKERYDSDTGAKHLNFFFESCVRELEDLARALGKTRIIDFDRGDLVALDLLCAEIAGIEYIEQWTMDNEQCTIDNEKA